MSDFDKWFHDYYESYTFRPSETEIRPVYKAAFNAGAAAQIEKDAGIADELHLTDEYKYRHGCSNQDAAAAIRAQLTQQEK